LYFRYTSVAHRLHAGHTHVAHPLCSCAHTNRPALLFMEYCCTVLRALGHSQSGSSIFLDKDNGGARHHAEPMASLDFERLYDDHAQAVFAFLLNFTRHESDTRDLLQELFVKVAKRPDLLEGVRDERAFLLRLAHNLTIDLVRRRGTRENYHGRLADEPESVFAPTADPDGQTFREALAAALGDLPADQRAVVHLKLWEGLTFEQIAELLSIPLNTAASRYRYGLDKLRERLRPLYDEIR
jgi:RNA polymerase sigma-70 factor (ECF subfamily)